MDNLINWLKENTSKAMGLPALLAGSSFFMNLIVALSDGKIDDNEWHTLISSANGAQFLVLGILMFCLRNKKYWTFMILRMIRKSLRGESKLAKKNMVR